MHASHCLAGRCRRHSNGTSIQLKIVVIYATVHVFHWSDFIVMFRSHLNSFLEGTNQLRWSKKSKINISQGSVATARRWGGHANYFSILHIKCYGNRLTFVETTVKSKGERFLEHRVVGLCTCCRLICKLYAVVVSPCSLRWKPNIDDDDYGIYGGTWWNMPVSLIFSLQLYLSLSVSASVALCVPAWVLVLQFPAHRCCHGDESWRRETRCCAAARGNERRHIRCVFVTTCGYGRRGYSCCKLMVMSWLEL